MKKKDPNGRPVLQRLSYRSFSTLILLSEILVSLGLAIPISMAVESLLPPNVGLPHGIWVALFGFIFLVIFVVFLNKIIYAPIKKLSSSMTDVASGNYNVSIKTRSRIREVDACYESFNAMVRELNAIEILQTDFVSNVSHEFKTPISAIDGYATLLQNEELSDEERQIYTEKILFNTRRLNELVGNILLLSKVENQSIMTAQNEFSLDEQIRQAIVLLEPKWSKKIIELDVELDEVRYVGAESLMQHVWTNLIDNAVKFDSDGGLVAIRLTEADGNITVTVRDNGPGVDEEAKKHIFDKFYQSDRSHRAEGNGLGLALVKRILDNCGGTICVENNSVRCAGEGGCTFTVTLPSGPHEAIFNKS